MKYCKDCEHNDGMDFCKALTIEDPVHGHVFRSCREARTDGGISFCGRDATLFQPRTSFHKKYIKLRHFLITVLCILFALGSIAWFGVLAMRIYVDTL